MKFSLDHSIQIEDMGQGYLVKPASCFGEILEQDTIAVFSLLNICSRRKRNMGNYGIALASQS